MWYNSLMLNKLRHNNKVSSTGYRLFFILQLLMQGGVSKTEILEKINENALIAKVSPDTIRLDINTLKAAGFEITTAGKSLGYKYFLHWNPLKINFTASEIRAFNQSKRVLMDLCEWQTIMNVYEVFARIAKFIKDDKMAQEFMNFDYFSNVDFRILKQLNVCCKNNNSIKITYNSPRSGDKTIEIVCKEIVYKKEQRKLYLWGISPQYKGLTYLRIDKISKIICTDLIKHTSELKFKTCKYRLRHTIGQNFKIHDNEKITQNTPEFIEIEAIVYSEFYFIQILLSYGRHCFWVQDGKIRRELVKKLKKMRELYK